MFGLLPALNDERKPVPNTELIKLSRGFVICASIAFVIGALLYCFRAKDMGQVRTRSSTLHISLKIFAVLSLITMTLLQIPEGIQHKMLTGNFQGISFANGIDERLSAVFFYAGVLAFADGMFPLKVSAIASSHHRSNLPLVLATTCGSLTRWIFCFLASILLMNKDNFTEGYSSAFVLSGVSVYLLIIVLPEIVET